MRFRRAKRVLLLVLLAGVATAPAVGQADKWEQAVQAGKKAQNEGRIRDAEKFFRQANEEAKKFAENDVRRVAGLQGLAEIYRFTARGRDAEPLYVRALTILEGVKGREHPEVALMLIDLARLYVSAWTIEVPYSNTRNPVASSTYSEMLPAGPQTTVNTSAPSAPATLTIPPNFPVNFARAEPLYQRALAILEKLGGPENAHYVATYMELAMRYQSVGKRAEAEATSLRALEILKVSPHATPLDTAIMKNNLAVGYHAQKKLEAAEQNYREAITILEDEGLETLPVLAATLEGYAKVLKEVGRKDEAKQAEKRAKAIREKISRQEKSR